MGRNIFLSVLTLIAGICIGVLVMLTVLDPTPSYHPNLLPPSTSVSQVPVPVPGWRS